ncbi:MAG: dCTP deaminase [Oligoflexia bacterium]|nr:dCTP deaminase [Oligoflexia bacterium]
MMLSNEDIKDALKSGQLIVEPFSDELVKSAGVTLHLGEKILKPMPGKIVDVRKKTVPDFEELTITLERPYALRPGEFLLGHTYQRITVGNSLGFFIEGRSTLARVGLTIVQTAMLVYPGHRNRAVTLELANHGPNTILLYPKMKIARVALFLLKTPASEEYDDTGKYREQSSVGRPIFEDEFLEE